MLPATTALLATHFAKPLTHRVTTVFADGTTRAHDTRSQAQADNYATGERRKVGKDLISRETGKTVRVVAVTVDRI
jgi:hypothetical protein